MRRALALTLLLVASCGDPGPRDRSAYGLLQHAAAAGLMPHASPTRRASAGGSVIGLALDPLAPLCADDADILLRFDDMATLDRTATSAVAEARRGFPGLPIPEGNALRVLHALLPVPKELEIDPSHPFVVLRRGGRWVSLLPAPSAKEGDRVRPVGSGYAVVGEPEAVAAYAASGRKGFFLPGLVSVRIDPALCTGILRGFGLPDEFERIDLSLRPGPTGFRIDVRLAPRAGTPSARSIDRARPAASLSARLLPSQAPLYVEFPSPAVAWENLFLGLPGGAAPEGENLDLGPMPSLRKALRAFAGDASAAIDVPPNAAGSAHFVSILNDPAAARTFLDSPDFRRLLHVIAGDDGHLEWMPEVFERAGAKVGAVTGYLGRERIRALRDGGPFEAALGTLLRGPAVLYVAVIGDKLGIVLGQRARPESERFFDRLAGGQGGENDHTAETTGLFDQRVAALSFDLPRLFAGVRESAPLWHPSLEPLRGLVLRGRCPVAAVATVEGGSLRFALRVGARPAAEVAAAVTGALLPK